MFVAFCDNPGGPKFQVCASSLPRHGYPDTMSQGWRVDSISDPPPSLCGPAPSADAAQGAPPIWHRASHRCF